MPRYEDNWGSAVEIVLDGTTVRTSRSYQKQPPQVRAKTYETADEARHAYGKKLATLRWMKEVGEPRRAGSDLLLDEHFAAGDDAFLVEVLRSASGGKLASLADRWATDARPWARAMMLAYIDDGCDRPEHKGLVKRLFKHVEKAGDDEAMSHFLVAFDALSRRLLVKRWGRPQLASDPGIRERLVNKNQPKVTAPQFSRATRRYLARRAYRYFRRLARKGDLARYGRGVRHALARYTDEALSTPARLLDAWGLMHALYRYSPAIAFGSRGVTLQADRGLAELAPAPHFPAAWQGVFEPLVELALGARSRTVRAWTLGWLEAHHAAELAALPFPRVKAMLASPHEELAVFGAKLLGRLAGLDALPIADWLELLAIDNLEVAPLVAAVVEKHVAPARLSLAQCIALACAPIAPVARLGLGFAKGKKVGGVDDLATIARIVKAGVAEVRSDGTAWVAATLAAHPAATYEHLRDLCDAPHADARAQALVVATTAKQLAPLPLWFALTESPYDDVRATVVKNAIAWRDAAPADALQRVWSTALLNVHRGSKTKQRVPRAIAERIASHPDEASELLPVLRHALRSVRPAERATALAALARAVRARPDLRELARTAMPELVITEEISS